MYIYFIQLFLYNRPFILSINNKRIIIFFYKNSTNLSNRFKTCSNKKDVFECNIDILHSWSFFNYIYIIKKIIIIATVQRVLPIKMCQDNIF